MSSVDTTIWPDSDSIPVGYVSPSGKFGPFAVLRLLAGSGATIQFTSDVAAVGQAAYLRELAKVATEVADQLDPQDGAKA